MEKCKVFATFCPFPWKCILIVWKLLRAQHCIMLYCELMSLFQDILHTEQQHWTELKCILWNWLGTNFTKELRVRPTWPSSKNKLAKTTLDNCPMTVCRAFRLLFITERSNQLHFLAEAALRAPPEVAFAMHSVYSHIDATYVRHLSSVIVDIFRLCQMSASLKM